MFIQMTKQLQKIQRLKSSKLSCDFTAFVFHWYKKWKFFCMGTRLRKTSRKSIYQKVLLKNKLLSLGEAKSNSSGASNSQIGWLCSYVRWRNYSQWLNTFVLCSYTKSNVSQLIRLYKDLLTFTMFSLVHFEHKLIAKGQIRWTLRKRIRT